MGRPETIEIVAVHSIRRSTEKAYCILDQRPEFVDQVIWLPKSQVELSHYHDADKGIAVFLVPVWLAREKGLEE